MRARSIQMLNARNCMRARRFFFACYERAQLLARVFRPSFPVETVGVQRPALRVATGAHIPTLQLTATKLKCYNYNSGSD